MDALIRTVLLAAAILSSGLLAGVFFAFSCAINPAMRRVGDEVYVRSVRAVNTAIVNGWFLSIFVGTPLLAIAAAIVAPAGAAKIWAIAGLACAIVAFVVTAAINVPLNNRLDAASTRTANEYADARGSFERRWNSAHYVRTVASIAAAVSLTVALIV